MLKAFLVHCTFPLFCVFFYREIMQCFCFTALLEITTTLRAYLGTPHKKKVLFPISRLSFLEHLDPPGSMEPINSQLCLHTTTDLKQHSIVTKMLHDLLHSTSFSFQILACISCQSEMLRGLHLPFGPLPKATPPSPKRKCRGKQNHLRTLFSKPCIYWEANLFHFSTPVIALHLENKKAFFFFTFVRLLVIIFTSCYDVLWRKWNWWVPKCSVWCKTETECL